MRCGIRRSGLWFSALFRGSIVLITRLASPSRALFILPAASVARKLGYLSMRSARYCHGLWAAPSHALVRREIPEVFAHSSVVALGGPLRASRRC